GRELRVASNAARGGHEDRRKGPDRDPRLRRSSRRSRPHGPPTELLPEQPAHSRAPPGAVVREPSACGPRACSGQDREVGLRVLDEGQLPNDPQTVLQVASRERRGIPRRCAVDPDEEWGEGAGETADGPSYPGRGR